MSKKAIGLLLALGLTAVLSACGGGGGETTPPAESPAGSPPAESPSPQ
jgi:ABC-type glycerol-3-phosphate transport system substrate-binding protein